MDLDMDTPATLSAIFMPAMRLKPLMQEVFVWFLHRSDRPQIICC